MASLALLALLALPAAAAPRPADSPAGRALYEQGVLADGQPLVGTRDGAPDVTALQAACIQCHRRSGLGSVEARSAIPPITADFLFHSPDDAVDAARLPYLPSARLSRASYDEQSLSRAIRDGVDADGRAMSFLMPRYNLKPQDFQALLQHLRWLDPGHVPGVSGEELHFATIVTPDADPGVRSGVLEVLRNFFDERNAATRLPGDQVMQTTGRASAVKHMFRVNRRWVLHVWELTGAPATWEAQLRERMRATPVFAVLSGAYGRQFGPVRAFCEAQAVPCILPNLEYPPQDADKDFYAIYFSRGVGLEVDLMAESLLSTGAAAAPVRIVYRRGDVGEQAALALQVQLADHPELPTRMLALDPQAGAEAVRRATGQWLGRGTVVLWLRASDIAALGTAPSGPVLLSGTLGGYERAPLPPAWRAQARMVYPIDLPINRRARMDYADGWFRVRRITVVAEHAQADTLLACGLMAETLKHMVDAFVPEYLIERMEDTVEHRVLTGYYPRLTLAPHQRYGSKGAYWVRFTGEQGTDLEPLGEWEIP